MPVTYSINVGQIIEATRKPDIFTVLQDLPDNTQKLISPRDVRDAFLSVWANSTIKLTTPGNNSSSEYIGVDSGNPEDRDVKKKILLGKRSVGNLDIMNTSLLNNDTDIFFYNTKSDGVTQSSTKIGFLSGTNSSLYPYAPYIQALSTTSSRIDFNINNPAIGGGPISILSNDGRVSVNGIIFPTVSESSASASNGRILRYSGTFPNGYLRWDESISSFTNIGTPGMTTSIFGSPVLLNGSPLEFYDDNLVPVTIGGVTQGSSFPQDSFTAGGFTTPGTGQNWPLSEIIRKILYPYIEPTLQISAVNLTTGTTYAEAGYSATFSISYSITSYAREDSEYVSDYFIWESSATNNIYAGSSFSVIPGSVTSSTFTYVTSSTTDFILSVSNVWPAPTYISHPFGYSFSATSSISFINPIFLGFDSSLITTTNGLSSSLFPDATKSIVPYPGASNSIFMTATGSGYLYFAHPSTYTTDVMKIKDPNGFIIHDSSSPTYSAFGNTYSLILSPAPFSGFWKLWRTTLECSYDGSGQFEFIF
jgi:hypothetical protein